MYGQKSVKVYAVTVPKNKQSYFGKSLTSRYRKSTLWFNTCYGAAGAARMVTDEKIVIGELNGSGLWINGRLEIDKDTSTIFYRKYDENGVKIKNSTQEFVDFMWIKSASERTIPDVRLADQCPGEEKTDAETSIDKKKGAVAGIVPAGTCMYYSLKAEMPRPVRHYQTLDLILE